MAGLPNLATILVSSNEGSTQMLTIQRFVMITVNFPQNGQQSKTFCHIEHRFVKESQHYTLMERRGRIVKWGGLCGLVSSMKVSQVETSCFSCSWFLEIYQHASTGLHLETFLYMLLQSDRVLAPPEPTPDFEFLARKALAERVENQWLKVPASRITHGYSDPENDEGPDRFFAWDNERPPYDVEVPAFEAQARPVSNGEYATYLDETGGNVPITWTSKAVGMQRKDGADAKSSSLFDKAFIKTVYGPVSLHLAADWPVMASFNELSGYAKWAGYRIPTFNEVRSIYNLVEQQKRTRNGVPKADHASTGLDPEEIFVDLTGCNAGLQHFHPVPVTQNGDRLSGLGDMGGAWEWTSTLLEPFENFKPMDIYPGYTGMSLLQI